MSRSPANLSFQTMLIVAAALAGGCGSKKSNGTLISLTVDLAYRGAEGKIVALETTVDDATHSAIRVFSRPGKVPLEFPTSIGIELGREVTGPVRIEVHGVDAHGVVLAGGIIEAQPIVVGKTQTRRLWLECGASCPSSDGGVDALPADSGRDAPEPDGSDACGNGKLDPGETCDTMIAMGQPGACPPATCDDGLACTIDTRTGSGCTAQCSHLEVRSFMAGDGCCPAYATHVTDPDCSATCGNGTIEPGEFCDQAIAATESTACPVAPSCVDMNPCTSDILISANTCNALCAHREITAFISGDSCCPAGATHTTDSDCPVVCGNGIVERDDETCDIGLAPGTPGACPAPCTEKDACTREVTEGSGCKAVCRSVPITELVGGDGCCPAGANKSVDSDCAAQCGNGILEPGEECEKSLPPGTPGACPTSCPAADSSPCMPRVLEGNAANCSAHCVSRSITTCTTTPDGCCPSGCNANNDHDCSATCGNQVVETVETCDIAINDPLPGYCPSACNDGNACTTDILLSGGTCNARCQYAPITTFVTGDGCCPANGNHNLDGDCPFVCGNGVVEGPKETCDPGITAGGAGACPTSCGPPSQCQSLKLLGDPMMCNVRCEADTITACVAGDTCCPMGCTHETDTDCPVVCGNGVVDSAEACDKGITAGNPGACPASCDDNDPCSTDATSGRVEDCNRTCTHTAITACTAGDRCCPSGCTGLTDSDCTPICGNGLVESSETCDPASSCPTTCTDDGDACTAEKLSGTALTCNVLCTHEPIVSCSGSTSDHCCPTGCTAKTDTSKFDTDCSASSTSGH